MHVAITLHVLSAVIWGGGMFFAFLGLRPVAATLLEPPLRLALWVRVFGNFFPRVWAAVATLLFSGYGMLFRFYGDMAHTPIYVHVMQALGLMMLLIFAHVVFTYFRRLKQAVAAEDWKSGAMQRAQIRRWIGMNLILGLLVVSAASGGRLVM